MFRKSLGFSLIELMVVIAILAILVAIAIPAYQDFAIRARVSEGLYGAAPAKIAVSETFQSNDAVPDQASTGFTSFQTHLIENISIADDGSGAIDIETRNTGAAIDVDLRLTPSLVVGATTSWACSAEAGESKYVPAECRN